MITSDHNPQLKDIRRLHRREARRAAGRFVAEGEDLLDAAAAAGWEPLVHLRAGVDVTPEALAKVSSLGSGTRALAVYEQRWGTPVGPLCVSVWGVRDPGNVGTVLRGALAFGVASVALGPGCADPYGPKAVRASMGAIFAVPVAREGEPLRGPARAEATLVVGAEREGLPDDVVAACDRVAHIPIGSESLNAAMAATVAMYELTRIAPP